MKCRAPGSSRAECACTETAGAQHGQLHASFQPSISTPEFKWGFLICQPTQSSAVAAAVGLCRWSCTSGTQPRAAAAGRDHLLVQLQPGGQQLGARVGRRDLEQGSAAALCQAGLSCCASGWLGQGLVLVIPPAVLGARQLFMLQPSLFLTPVL